MIASKNKYTGAPVVCMDYASLYWQMPLAFDNVIPGGLDGMSQKELEDYIRNRIHDSH